jgi:hypothetical protein
MNSPAEISMADAGDEITLAESLRPSNAKAAVLLVECHALDKTRKDSLPELSLVPIARLSRSDTKWHCSNITG